MGIGTIILIIIGALVLCTFAIVAHETKHAAVEDENGNMIVKEEKK